MKDRIIYLLKAIGVVYLLYFLCRLTFFLFQYPKFIESTFWGIIKAFFVGTLFDTVSISYSNSLFIILVALPFVSLQNRIVKGLLKSWLVVSNAIATALNLIDVVYFDYSQRRTGDEILVLGHNTGDLLGTYLTDFWHIILIFICYVAFLGIFAYRLRTPHTYLPHTSRQWGLSMGTFLIVTGFCVLGMRGGLFRTPLLTQDAAKFVDAKLVAVATNTPHQIIATIQAENLKAKALMDIAVAEKLFYPYLHYRDAKPNKKNIVFIILESFDKEYIGYYNQGKGYTPFLDSLLALGISFDLSYANGTPSIECPPAIFSSIPSLMNDSYINSQYNTNRLSGIDEMLHKEGYSTAFYHGGENGTMNFDAFIGITNFGKYYGLMQYPQPQHSDGHWGIPDEPYLQYFAEQLNQTPEPFCQAVFTLSSHHPYLIPEAYQNTLPKGSMPIHQAIAYGDLALRKFFHKARTQPWYKNTVFVLTADHASITDNPNYVNYFGDYCVPVLYYGHGIDSQRVQDRIIQHKDLMPSTLYMLGYNKPFFSMGRNVFDRTTKPFSVTYRDGIYTYLSETCILESNLTDPPRGSNFVTQQPLSNKSLDSLNTMLKAYLQVYQERLITNKMY